MHIKSVKFKNHDILGNLELDFCNADGTPNNTIIIAGGNGIGKSVILNAIHTHLKQQNEKIRIETDFLDDIDSLKLEKAAKIVWNSQYELLFNKIENGEYCFNYNKDDKIIYFGSLANSQFSVSFQSYFYPASLHFASNHISAVTSRTEDMPITTTSLGEEIANTINQTLVDIRSLDNADLAQWVDDNPSSIPANEIKRKRSKTFKKCFDTFFDGKTLSLNPKINTQIEFEENGKSFPIQSLSTGEKQIVYRAGSMLAHKTALTGSIVLFDEPEISMHPEWQTKIVPFYRELLGDDTQIIIATHSPFIIHGSPFAKKIIIQKDADGKREVMQDAKYYAFGEVAPLEVFNVNLWRQDSDKEMVLFVEGVTDITILTEAWNKLYPHEAMFFEIKNGYSKSHISVLFKDEMLWKKSKNKKIVGLFDFDEAYNDWNGVWGGKNLKRKEVETSIKKGLTNKHNSEKGWVSLLPVPEFRENRACLELKSHSILPIEYLFQDSKIPQNFVKDKKIAGGGKVEIFDDSKKADFAELTKTFAATDFDAFIPIFDLLKGIKEGNYD